METRQFRIKGMHCDNCVAAVTKVLQAAGAPEVHVDLKTGTAVVTGSDLPSAETLVAAIEDIGFDADAD